MASAPLTSQGETTSSDAARGEVIILGAGFSKAVHNAFPVMPELAAQVAGRLQAAPSTGALVQEIKAAAKRKWPNLSRSSTSAFDFEAWLSRLAEPQPHLSEWENLERRALFVRASAAIRDVLLDTEREALGNGGVTKVWPYELVWLLHVRKATVITMNYDEVVEHLAESVLWEPWARAGLGVTEREVSTDDLLAGLPPSLPSPAPRMTKATACTPARAVVDLPVKTLRLLKLHGSLSWFASPDDRTGTTLARWAQRGSVQGNGDEQRRVELPGREPFIVPPASLKSRYIENPVVREIWQRARDALATAPRVTIVGYSLPAADQAFSGLLADTIARRGIPVVVVNPRPNPVVAQLRRIGIVRRQIETITGGEAIEAWSRQEIERQAEEATQGLLQLCTSVSESDPIWVRVGWGPVSRLGVQSRQQVSAPGAIDDSGDLVLELRPAAQQTITDPWPLPTFAPLLKHARRVVAVPDGTRLVVVDFRYSPPGPYRAAGQLLLITAGRWLPRAGDL
jgi:hypothetical protein